MSNRKGRLPAFPARTAFLVPKAAYKDGAFDVSFIRDKGPNVVVAELWLLRVLPLKKGGPQSAEVVDLNGSALRLYGVFPNPGQTSFEVRYALAKSGKVSLAIYNVAGQLVRRLVEGNQPAGHHFASWDGKDDVGLKVRSGSYFCRLEAAGIQQVKQFVIVR